MASKHALIKTKAVQTPATRNGARLEFGLAGNFRGAPERFLAT
jgi:hypothetical protein